MSDEVPIRLGPVGPPMMHLDLSRGYVRMQTNDVLLRLIEQVVAEHWSLTVEEIHARTRRLTVARPRHMAMYFMRQFTDASLHVLGRWWKRDHATVMHAVRVVEAEIAIYPELRARHRMVAKAIEARVLAGSQAGYVPALYASRHCAT